MHRLFRVTKTILLFLVLAAANALAGSATWNLNPTDTSWHTASNWTPATVPNGPTDIATLGVSTKSDIQIVQNDVEVSGIVFNPNASAFTIVLQTSSSGRFLTISGAGITNNSGNPQNFLTAPDLDDATNSATAGDQTVFTNNGGSTIFQDTSSARSASLIGNISFLGDSSGGTARVAVFENGSLDISAHNAPGVTVGSLEGSGTVTLGGNNLTVGGNEHETTFSGVITDGGAGGSLTKGRRRLILTNANDYSGGTSIRGGSLFVRNRSGSGTGSGPVQVDAGTLGGSGTIAGPVIVGTARGSGAVAELSPGDGAQPGTLTLLDTLTFHGHGVYRFDLNGDDATADQVIANGVTIQARANFFVTNLGVGILRNAQLYDSGVGLWSPTDDLIVLSSGHSATLLPNGLVLAAGGTAGPGPTAELYDPASATWTATGSLITARGGHTATLLPNGKVLVAGGNLGFGPTASAELYDPASGVWTATGNMTHARYFHTATLLPNGQVLVVGSPGEPTAELYDPASGSWATTARPITSRWAHTATLLPNGEVLVAGGSMGIGIPTPLSEVYDPATATWAATGSLHKARQVHSAVLLPGGKVLAAGGQGLGISDLTSAELYDPSFGTWTATGDLAIPRSYFTLTSLANGKVVAVGGNNGINFMEASVELYDPASGLWTTTDSLDPGRYNHTATLLSDGKVLVAGGVGLGLPAGAVFTVIRNTAATPISGAFANLPEGSTIVAGGKFCRVSYSGGDGNDLTLTVLP